MAEISVEDIIRKYIAGNASDHEIKQIDEWYDSFDSQNELYFAKTVELKLALAKGFIQLKLKLLID